MSFIPRIDLQHAVKSNDMGPTAFSFPPKEGMLLVFIPLKNP
jgi:hypothetical protein